MDSTSNILIDIDSNINNSNSSANCVDSSSSNTSSHGKKHKIESLESTRLKKISKPNVNGHNDETHENTIGNSGSNGAEWKIKQLINMGFDRDVSEFSLQNNNFNVEKAIAFLLRQTGAVDRALNKKLTSGRKGRKKRTADQLHNKKGKDTNKKTKNTMENMETAVEKKRRLREKLFSTQIKDIQRVFERLKKQDKYGHFLKPVQEEDDPEYAKTVLHPMDFESMEKKIIANEYILYNDPSHQNCNRVDWRKYHKDFSLIFTNAIGYNPYENVHGNIHKEAIKMKKLLDETISNKEAKHLEEIKALVTEEELDRLQLENKEPAVQREWRKQPFKPRAYEQISESEPARCLSHGEKIKVYDALRTTMNGPPPIDDKIRSNNPSYKKSEVLSWLVEVEDGNGGKKTCLKNPKGYLVDNINLIETDVWGIDCYTRKNIVLAIGNILNSIDEKTFFIKNILLPYVNMQESHVAWDMRKALIAIIDDGDEKLEQKYVAAAHAVLSAVNRWEDHNFRIHPKGKGIVCIKEGGIKKDEFINEYQGEVYPAWQWNERETAIEMLAAKQVDKDVLPDFWNIQLERHVNDPDGHDVLTIDPSQCANFVSRLSHSCQPNCQTICVAVNNKYMVAMYSIRSITKGEELTFDYNAVTASKREFSLAACLCGSVNCRGSFLYLTKTSGYHEVIETDHTPIRRFGMLVKSCMNNRNQFKNYSENGIDAASTEDEDHEFDAEKSQKILKKNKEVERIKMNKQEKEFIKQNAQKKPPTSYIIFLMKKREEAKLENTEIKYKGFMAQMGLLWGQMTEEAKKPYVDEASALREEYNIRKLEFENGPLAEFRENVRKKKEKELAAEDEIKRAKEESRVAAIVEESSRCDKHGLRSSALAGLPTWAKKYASKCLAFVEYEKRKLPSMLMNQAIYAPTSIEEAEAEAKGIADQREKNLVISMDKVRHALRQQWSSEGVSAKLPDSIDGIVPDAILENNVMECSAAPVYVLDNDAVSGMLWNDYGSIAAKTFDMLKKIYSYTLDKANELISIHNDALMELDEPDYISDFSCDSSDSDDSNSSEDSDEEEEEEEEEERKKKKIKDPNAPKRPLSSYFLFLNDNRVKYKEKFPECSNCELIKVLGEAWSSLNPDEKVKYDEKAKVLRQEYVVKKEKYDIEKAEEDRKKMEIEREEQKKQMELAKIAEAELQRKAEEKRKLLEKLLPARVFKILKRIEELVQTVAWTLKDARRALTCLRDEIRTLSLIDKKFSWEHLSLCDLITMYLHTETFFTLHSYRRTRSRCMHIPMADVPGTKDDNLSNLPVPYEPYFETTVEYDEHYIHKELLYWYDQGNNLQMPADLYGCVRLPSIECCFRNVDCSGEVSEENKMSMYNKIKRKNLIKYFEEKRVDKPWPKDCEDTFPDILSKSMYQHVYGSPLFDELLKDVGDDQNSVPRTIRDLRSLSLGNKYKPLFKTEKVLASLQPVVEPTEENWIQCENPDCLKWRRVPTTVDVNKVKSPWVCKDNIWNPDVANCSIPEESYDKSTVYAYEVEDIAGAIGEYVDGFCQLDSVWHVCKIVGIREVDLEKQYLLHYSGWQSKYDEWVKGNSKFIKPLSTHTTKEQAARWIRKKKKKVVEEEED